MGELFSIIIPLYNKEEYIINTLNSVLTQDFFNYEVIIIDDLSTDKSFELVCNFINKNNLENYSVYKNKDNKGVSYSRNKGIELSKGDYVIFLDADDEICRSDFLSMMNYYIKKYNCNYMVITRNYYDRFIKPQMSYRKKHIYNLEKNLYKIIDKENFANNMNFPFGGSASAILSRELINKKRFKIDEMNFEDWEFFFDRYSAGEPYFCSTPNIKINFVNNSLSKLMRTNNGIWSMPSFYNSLENEKKTKLRKKFFWIWLASMLKKNPSTESIKENFKEYKKNLIKDMLISRYSVYCLLRFMFK